MGKKFLIVFVAAFLGLGIANSSFAEVIGSGTFSLIFPAGVNYSIGDYGYSTSYTDPNTGQTIQVNDYFAYIYEIPGSYIAYGLNRSSIPYQGYGSYLGSGVSGSHEPNTGSQSFSFSSVSPDPGNVTTWVSVNFVGSASFTGTLQGFGYAFSYSGQEDNPNDLLSFITQMQISYGNNVVYSDYGTQYLVTDPAANYRTNWAYFYNVASGNYYGTITFDYSSFGDQTWFISWDFMGSGMDTSGGGQQPVPEPATMLLLGSGLIGLAGYGRKKFFKK